MLNSLRVFVILLMIHLSDNVLLAIPFQCSVLSDQVLTSTLGLDSTSETTAKADFKRFELGLNARFLGNQSHVTLVKTYSLREGGTVLYFSQPSWQFGTALGINFNTRISFHSGVLLVSKRFDILYDYNNAPKDPILLTADLKEELIYISVPVFIRLNLLKRKNFILFSDAGYYWGNLQSGASNRTIMNSNGYSDQYVSKFDHPAGKPYNNMRGYRLGMGLKYNWKNFDFNVDLNRFNVANGILNNPEVRYNDVDLILSTQYVPDDIDLQDYTTLSIGVGYRFNVNWMKIKHMLRYER